MKKTISRLALVTVLILVFSLLAACSGKTPDVIASEAEAERTLENLDWSFEVEGAEKTTYTLAEARTHEMQHMITTCKLSGEGDVKAAPKSFRVDGISFRDFLKDVGAENATAVTYYGHDIYGKEMTYTFTPAEVQDEKILIGWISNKDNLLSDSITYVGVFAPNSSATFVGCTSITKIVIG